MFFFNAAKSGAVPNENNILLYASFKNYNQNKEVDLVLFLPGYGNSSKSLLSKFSQGGLELSHESQTAKYYLENKYRDDVIFVSFDSGTKENYKSPEHISKIIDNINKLNKLYQIKNIILLAKSSGASLTLNIVAKASNEIKSKIKDIVFISPLINSTETNLIPPKTKIKIITQVKKNKQIGEFYIEAKKKHKNIQLLKASDNIEATNLYKKEISKILKPTKVKTTSSNRILIYTDLENLSIENKSDLVLFFPGWGLSSVYLLTKYLGGGLELLPEDGHFSNTYRKNIIFASIDTNPKTHFGSPKVTQSVLENIMQLLKIHNIKNIYLVGGSAGSSLALNIASLAQEEIKNKITGVLVYLPITDYVYTLKNTKNTKLRDGLYKHFIYEDPDGSLPKKSSPITYIKSLPDKAKIVLIANSEDITAPPEQVEEYYKWGRVFGKNIILYKVPGNHETRTFAHILKKELEGLRIK
ncbi:MAG: alpha/beta hydrolase fold domain-containing protein [Candidatus Melainabacteria bacterium]|nr:alpha/beta hydrolase fold domain-containing protein [Candidatus Melainabacteria bacterium]